MFKAETFTWNEKGKGTAMKKSMLRGLFCLVCLTWLVLSSVTALAWVDDYPSKYKTPKMDAVIDEWAMFNRECTSFAAFRLNTKNGIPFKNSYLQKGGNVWGNAAQWKAAAQRAGIRVDNIPLAGDIAWRGNGQYGHVAWVEKVAGNKIYVEEYNFKKNNTGGIYTHRTVTAGDGQFDAYIHLHRLEVCTEKNGELHPISETLPIGEWEDVMLYGLRDGKWEAPLILTLKSPSKAVVCDGNLVTGMFSGKATITAEDPETGVKTDFQVEVKKPSIKLSVKEKTIYVGQKFDPEPTVLGKVKKIIWSSSKSGIVRIDKFFGTITGEKAGSTTVTGRIDGTQIEAKCKITVKEPSISLNKKDLSLWTGQSYKLKATVKGPSTKVKWKSSKPKIIEVDPDGTVTARKMSLLGVKITATANGKSSSCIVRALIKPFLKFDKTTLTLPVGKSATLSYTAKGLDGDAVWKTSNKKIATVKNGTVNAKKTGSVTITLKIGSKKTKCVINVTASNSIYKTYLKKAKSYFGRRKDGSMNMAVYDIDKDGVQELILERQDQNMPPCYDVFTYANGMAKKVGTLGMWCLAGVDEKPYIVSYIPDKITICRLKGGKLKTVRQMEFPATSPDNSSKKKTWNKLCSKYVSGKANLQVRYYSKSSLGPALKRALSGAPDIVYNK